MLVMSCRYTAERALQDPGRCLGRAAGTGKMQNISKCAYLKMTLCAIVNVNQECGSSMTAIFISCALTLYIVAMP